MKTIIFLSASVMFQSQNAKADVDLLSGAFQYNIPGTSLEYSSRRAEISKTGFGWLGRLPTDAKSKIQNGNLVKLEWNKQIWLFQYDSFHNLTEIKQPSGTVTWLKYNEEQDRVQSLDVAGGCKEEFRYLENAQSLQLEARKSCPELGVEAVKLRAIYSSDRRRLEQVAWQKTDGRMEPTRYSKGSVIYDELGRLALYVMDDEFISYEYDAGGSITAITRGKDRIQFEYDMNSRLSKIITSQNGEIKLKYDSSGRLESLDENTLAVATALQAALEKLSPIEGGLTL